jgi:hypothetical protein
MADLDPLGFPDDLDGKHAVILPELLFRLLRRRGDDVARRLFPERTEPVQAEPL